MKNKLTSFVCSTRGKAVAGVVAFSLVMAGASVAGATGTTIITSAFATETTQLVTYMGLAAALVFVLLGLGVGIRLAVKWIKFAIGRGS